MYVGRILYTLGRYGESLESYKEVLAIKPTHGDAKKMLPKVEQALQQLQQVRSVNCIYLKSPLGKFFVK